MRSIRAGLLAVLFTGGVCAQSGGSFTIPRHTIDAGGREASTGGGQSHFGVVGQPDPGVAAGGAFTLSGGFFATTAPSSDSIFRNGFE